MELKRYGVLHNDYTYDLIEESQGEIVKFEDITVLFKELFNKIEIEANENGTTPLEKPKFSKELVLLDYEKYRTSSERGFKMKIKEIEE